MKKTLVPIFFAYLAAASPAAAVAAGTPGEENAACESASPGGDFVEFRCPLPVSRTETHWRFKAEFAGGHDDTSASMTLSLDERPVECKPGSKTRLFGEDGNVSLVCDFDVRAPGNAPPVLVVSLLWSHAQYVRTELVVTGEGR